MKSPSSPQAPYVVGIDMGGTAIKAAAFSAAGTLLDRRTGPTSDGGMIGGLPAWADSVRRLMGELDEAQCRGLPHTARAGASVGIATPGLASRDQLSIASMPNRLVGIEGFNWTQWLGVPAPVLNDAHAALLGEVWHGAARGRSNVVMITLGTGVGGAAMVDGRLLRGHLGRAGHLGHVTVAFNSPVASIFGMPGALETAIGNYNVAQRSEGRFLDSRSLVEAATAGDRQAVAIWEKSIQALGCAIGSFINAFDPEIVVIGGGVAKAGNALWKPLQRVLDEVEWRPYGTAVPIVPAELGDWSGAYGAAYAALQFSPSDAQRK
ncbi:MAG: ROK family protein [Candidatus Methylacidiphilales bacterium]